jgi:hypothetical protein
MRAWFQHLNLKSDDPLSNVAFNFNLRRHTKVSVLAKRLTALLTDGAGAGDAAKAKAVAGVANVRLAAGAYTRSLQSTT